jgi:formate dehydrogenase subunit delta
MSMAEQVVRMANQIAANLAARGEQAAVRDMAEHLAQFWDPRMKAAILEVDPALLSEIARAAVQKMAQRA